MLLYHNTPLHSKAAYAKRVGVKFEDAEEVIEREVLVVGIGVEIFAATRRFRRRAVAVHHTDGKRVEIRTGRRAVREVKAQKVSQDATRLVAQDRLVGDFRVERVGVRREATPIVDVVAVKTPLAEPHAIPMPNGERMPFIIRLGARKAATPEEY